MKNLIKTTFLGLFITFSSACEAEFTNVDSTDAVATIQAVSDVDIEGQVKFTQPEEAVRIHFKIKNLPPNQKFGTHIHENGDCTGKEAKNAGSHFNPHDHPHGSLKNSMSHAGDLGNIESDENGVIDTVIETNLLSLKEPSPTYIVDRSIVIHAGVDDLTTQPSGSSGTKIGCGVINIH